jgi:hypothetical protein
VPYTPITLEVYLAAQSALAGFYSGQFIEYADWYAELADAWGQAVDQAWGTASYTALDLSHIATCSLVRFMTNPAPLGASPDPARYAYDASAIVALVRAGTGRVVSQGLNPNADGPSNVSIGLLVFGPSTPTQVLQSVSAGSVLYRASVLVREPFDGSPALSLGTSANPTLVFSPTDLMLSATSQYSSGVLVPFDTTDQLVFNFSANSATTGAGLLLYSLGS